MNLTCERGQHMRRGTASLIKEMDILWEGCYGLIKYRSSALSSQGSYEYSDMISEVKRLLAAVRCSGEC